jgi:hypothetical protein
MAENAANVVSDGRFCKPILGVGGLRARSGGITFVL